MTIDPERVKRLGMAAEFCFFDKKLRSSGNASILWGTINLVIGGTALSAHNDWGAVGAILGLALVIAGAYSARCVTRK